MCKICTARFKAISKLQKEKNAMMETLNGLRDHVNSVKNQLDVSRASQQEASKQKEELKKELNCFRNELQQVRDDRDHQLNRAIVFFFFYAFNYLPGRQMADLTAMETISENEEKKKMLRDLQDRLADAEQQISEGEKLRKKLHNTILELKGNIRVFCRVRPLLPDGENNGVEGAALSYPTSAEYLGRGIDLMHNSQKDSFTFDKVFDQDASQEDVFVEISALLFICR